MSNQLITANQSCKNCSIDLNKGSKYCKECGAKIVRQRITVKSLISDLLQNSFGWDNRFFVTIKYLILCPGKLLREYFGGTRKKYVNPFTFLAIGMAINLFAFSVFDLEFLGVMDDYNETQVAIFADTFGDKIYTEEVQKKQIEDNAKFTRVMLKYFNLTTLATLPIYTFMAFITYRKPYNYAEHIVVNCYIQGFSFLTTTIIFFASITIHPALYYLIYPLLLVYYTYTYGKLYRLSIGQSLLKIMLFIGILVGLFIISILVAFVFALIFGE